MGSGERALLLGEFAENLCVWNLLSVYGLPRHGRHAVPARSDPWSSPVSERVPVPLLLRMQLPAKPAQWPRRRLLLSSGWHRAGVVAQVTGITAPPTQRVGSVSAPLWGPLIPRQHSPPSTHGLIQAVGVPELQKVAPAACRRSPRCPVGSTVPRAPRHPPRCPWPHGRSHSTSSARDSGRSTRRRLRALPFRPHTDSVSLSCPWTHHPSYPCVP